MEVIHKPLMDFFHYTAISNVAVEVSPASVASFVQCLLSASTSALSQIIVYAVKKARVAALIRYGRELYISAPISGVVSRFVKTPLAANNLQWLYLTIGAGREQLLKNGNLDLALCVVTFLANHRQQLLCSNFLSLSLTDTVDRLAQAEQKPTRSGHSQNSSGHRVTPSNHSNVMNASCCNKGGILENNMLHFVAEKEPEEENVAQTVDDQAHEEPSKLGTPLMLVFYPQKQQQEGQLAKVKDDGRHTKEYAQHDEPAARVSLPRKPSTRQPVATPRVNVTVVMWLLVWLIRASLGGAFQGTGVSGFLSRRPRAMSTTGERYFAQYTSLNDDLVKGKKWFDTHVSGNESPYSTTHMVNEHLRYVPRDHTAETLVELFEEYQEERSSELDSSMDKSVNPLIALPGPPGSGKSTFLAHFFYGPQVKRYVEKWGQSKTPLISLFSFNSAMGCERLTHCVALGLRFVFGALRASCGWPETWSNFSSRHMDHKDMSVSDALWLLREVFGRDRRILIGVDEIAKIDGKKDPNMNAELALSELCSILDTDGKTDLVVSSLSPAYVKDLLTGSQRDIIYVPIIPLGSQDLDFNFRESGDLLVTQVRAFLGVHYKKFSSNPQNERVLRTVHRLTSGHPRTVEKLRKAVANGAVLRRLQSMKLSTADPYNLMRTLATLDVLNKYCKPPTTEEEREYILSVQPRNVEDDTTFRFMLEQGKCTIFELSSSSQLHFRITTTLASFFRMVKDIQYLQVEQLGPLSRAAKTLFTEARKISEVWERAHGLSVVSRIHSERFALGERVEIPMSLVLGLGVNNELFGCSIVVDDDLVVKIMDRVADAREWQWQWKCEWKWTPNTLIVPPDRQPGFDLAVCLCGTNQEQIWVYIEIKVAPSSKNTTTEQILGNKLKQTVVGHVQRTQQKFTTLADIPLEAQLATLKDVYFVLSRYGCELEGDMMELRDKVVAYCKKEKEQDQHDEALPGIAQTDRAVRLRERAREFDLVLAFIERHWDTHVAFQGTQEMEKSMVPVVLPLAQLVQDTLVDDDE